MAMSQGAWVCHFLAEIVELVAFIFSLPFRLLAEILSGGGGGGGGDGDLQDAHDYFVEEGRKHLAGPGALHLLGERRRDALSALDAALSAGYGYGYHDLLPLEERADALVARAEIELARYLRCTLLNSGHRGQAIADLREAVRICPDNGRANALLLKYN
uniref:Uncharacterized protein n=1 Tax=Oryza glumipatula TaxID=40148 RepID=A0A0D9YNY8_9ORYZ